MIYIIQLKFCISKIAAHRSALAGTEKCGVLFCSVLQFQLHFMYLKGVFGR